MRGYQRLHQGTCKMLSIPFLALEKKELDFCISTYLKAMQGSTAMLL
jgi:hypothetical protein